MPGYPGPDRMETGGKKPRRKPGYNYPPAGNRGYIGQSSSMRAIPPDFQLHRQRSWAQVSGPEGHRWPNPQMEPGL